ncbi:MAG: hypothetical protein PHF26_04760, partial [Candidatus Gracilibacteria bacterium]|nr:hypothetical protein [Candidatus Gracilibacteria bacterium]
YYEFQRGPYQDASDVIDGITSTQYYKDIFSSFRFYGDKIIQNLYIQNVKENETIDLTKSEDMSCEYPIAGKKTYSGNYELVFGDKTIDLGNKTFVQGEIYDKQVVVRKLPKTGKDIFIIYQYGTCISNEAYIYGYNDKLDKLFQYKFKNKGEKVLTDSLPVDYYGNIKILSSSLGDNISLTMYNRETGKDIEYKYLLEDNLFVEE